jgi:hypothetical protein
MMAGKINNGPGYKIIIDSAALSNMLRGPNGEVVRDLIRRAETLQRLAKNQCGFGKGNDPHGHLRNSIVKRVMTGSGATPQVMVGSSHPIALIHHEGTQPHTIEPKRANALAWEDGSAQGGMRFATIVSHPGTKPNRYLTDNLPAISHESGNYK